jgi:hypothetical protein
MGKSFKRNNSDSYKYGSNKKPKPKRIRHTSNFDSKLEEEQEEWRSAFRDLDVLENSDNDRTKPNRT